MSPELICPSCKHQHGAAVLLRIETSRRVAKRPVTPELIHLYPKSS